MTPAIRSAQIARHALGGDGLHDHLQIAEDERRRG